MQTLLRGVVPDSFPSLLSAAPAEAGERRLVAIDDNVYCLYGAQIHQVRHSKKLLTSYAMYEACEDCCAVAPMERCGISQAVGSLEASL